MATRSFRLAPQPGYSAPLTIAGVIHVPAGPMRPGNGSGTAIMRFPFKTCSQFPRFFARTRDLSSLLLPFRRDDLQRPLPLHHFPNASMTSVDARPRLASRTRFDRTYRRLPTTLRVTVLLRARTAKHPRSKNIDTSANFKEADPLDPDLASYRSSDSFRTGLASYGILAFRRICSSQKPASRE